MKSEVSRPYTQRRRADRAEETHRRVVAATTAVFVEAGFAGLTLVEVARRAGVTVQTVIRRFGDKEGLVAAAAAAGAAEVESQRGEASVGDVVAAVANLVEHYEAFGRVALRLLADEGASQQIAAITAAGRALHRRWCARVFAPFLTTLGPAVRRRRLAQFVAVCDVYTWRLLRIDGGLSAAQTRLALVEMLTPLTQRPPATRTKEC